MHICTQNIVYKRKQIAYVTNNMKIYYYGKRINTYQLSLKRRIETFTRKVIYVIKLSMVTGTIATFIFTLGFFSAYPTTWVYAAPETVQSPTKPIKEVVVPILLQKIADAESGVGCKRGTASHYRNGQVVTNGNKDGSVDIGKYQINLKYHNKEASKLGYDLATEDGNTKMAIHIFNEQGTTPWNASKDCWDKLK